MMDLLDYRYLGTRYVLVEAGAFRRSRGPGAQAFHHASALEARAVVEAMARHAPTLLDRLCRALDGGAVMVHGVARRSTDFGDPRVDRVLRALGGERRHAHGEAPAFARIYLVREPPQHIPVITQEDPEAQAIDQAIALLGREPLMFRGNGYRLMRVGLRTSVPNRDQFETLSQSELLSFLRDCASDAACPAGRKSALAELLALAEAQRAKNGRTEIALLRRQRSYARSPDDPPAITPSELRAAQQPHWVELEALDKDKLPMAGVALEVVLVSGGTTQLSTNELGLARLDNLQAGTLTIRVLGMDGSAWRPLSGAAPSASSKQPGTLTHVVAAGECVEKIAQRYGVQDWRVMWNDAKNAALKKRRKNPHVLHPGDTLLVAPRVHEIARATDARHTIEVARAEKRVRVQLRTLGDGVLKDVEYDYSYSVGDQRIEKPGSAPTNDQGILEETLPVTVCTLHITLRALGLRLRYDVSSLAPARDDDTQAPRPKGIRQRLHALGYATGSAERAPLAGVDRALALFQQLSLQRTTPQGDPDEETLGALERHHTA